MDSRSLLVNHVTYLLKEGGAHPSLEHAVEDVPAQYHGMKVPGLEHTLWEQLEHIRICQWDILEFSRNHQHVSPEFPDGYWPANPAPKEATQWGQCVASILSDRDAMINLLADPKNDPYAPIPHGQGQTLLREALLIADHNAYHVGQIVYLRRLLGCWD